MNIVARIINQYKEIIAKDGEVDENQLREILEPDTELPERYKTPENLDKIINKIITPPKPTKQEIMAQRIVLYDLGLSDKDIAEKQGVKIGAIINWRSKRGLKDNSKVNIDRKILKLYADGLSDRKIGTRLHISAQTVFDYRKEHKLAANSHLKE